MNSSHQRRHTLESEEGIYCEFTYWININTWNPSFVTIIYIMIPVHPHNTESPTCKSGAGL